MKYLGIGLGVILVGLLVWAIGYSVYQNYFLEKPNYTVTDKFETFEIRDYNDYIVAKVQVDADGREGVNQGFTVLADFIFGNNTAANKEGDEKIAMTSPVLDSNESEKISMTSPVGDNVEGGTRYISFVMPGEYTLETLPTPTNDRIIIEEAEKPRFAVMTVTGSPSQTAMESALDDLKSRLDKEEIEYLENDYSFAYYDPPLTPAFMRRNEVLVRLK